MKFTGLVIPPVNLCDVGFHIWQTDVVYLALAQCEASWVFGGHKIDTKMWRASSSHSKLKFLEVDHELKIQQDNLANFQQRMRPIHTESADLPWLTSRERSHNLSSQHLLNSWLKIKLWGSVSTHITDETSSSLYIPSKSLNFWCRIIMPWPQRFETVEYSLMTWWGSAALEAWLWWSTALAMW